MNLNCDGHDNTLRGRVLRSLRGRRLAWLMAVGFSMVNCSNVYEPMSPKDSDAAIYEEAVKALNRSDFAQSIANFNKLPASFLDSKVEYRENFAGALAGRCGFLFATFQDSISSTDFGTTPLFKALMNQFTQKTISPVHCTLAEAQIKAIWASRSPTAKQRLFISLLSMAKIGVYLRQKADRDGDDDLGDGDTDPTFDMCTAADDDDHLTDDEMKEVITGFSLMLLNITAFAADLGMGDTISDLEAVCAAIPDSPCSVTEAQSVTPEMIDSMRDLLNTNEDYTTANGALADVAYGIGNCDAGTTPLVTGCCP